MGFSPAIRRTHLSPEDYLSTLDAKVGLAPGSLLKLCLAAVKSKTQALAAVRVTYRGVTRTQKRLGTRQFVGVRKGVFLIEFTATKAGKPYDRVVQVHLELANP